MLPFKYRKEKSAEQEPVTRTLWSYTPRVKERAEETHAIEMWHRTCTTTDPQLTHTQVHLLTTCLLIQNVFQTSFSKIRFENLHLSLSYARTCTYKEARSTMDLLFGGTVFTKQKSWIEKKTSTKAVAKSNTLSKLNPLSCTTQKK